MKKKSTKLENNDISYKSVSSPWKISAFEIQISLCDIEKEFQVKLTMFSLSLYST